MRAHPKILAVALICLTATAQKPSWYINCANQLPRPGDCLDIEMYEGVTPGAPGVGKLWDFTDAVSRGEAQKLTVTGITDSLLTMRFSRHRMYYSLTGDTLLWHGYETRNILLTDTLGTLAMRFPLAYGDSCDAPFRLIGRYALERPAVNLGHATLRADAEGTLIMPEGDTIPQVIRVCREYRGVPRLGRSATQLAASDTMHTPEVVYREYDWYAYGYRYPVFSLRQAKTITPTGETDYGESYAWTCTPHTQLLALRDDAENEKEREKAKRDNNHTRQGEHAPAPAATPYTDLHLSDTGTTLAIDFESTQASTTLSLIVSDSSGISYITIPAHPVEQGHNTLTIDTSRLPAGEYALLLIDGSLRHSHTFTHR